MGRATSMMMTPTFFSRAAISAAAKVAGGHVVVVPEAQVDEPGRAGTASTPGERKSRSVCAHRRRSPAGVPGKDVQDAGAKSTVLVLLAPDARGRYISGVKAP